MQLRYIKNSKIFLSIEAITFIFFLCIIVFKGFNLGIDFTGGSLFQFQFQQGTTVTAVQSEMSTLASQFPNLKEGIVQSSGNNTMNIRTAPLAESEKESVVTAISEQFPNAQLQSYELIGPSISSQLVKSGILAVIVGCIAIVLYITIRFEFSFAMGAIISLIHDIVMAAGIISLIGWQIDSTFIAAILTILGYSINDTIVIFDRIRENRRKLFNKDTLENIIDSSISQTFTRSINSSVTTCLAILAMLVFGGLTLHTFLLTLLIGIISGTYSSIFVASPIVFLIEERKRKKGKTKKQKIKIEVSEGGIV
ncbi:MAG: protein translocase subunit SecF [Fusobacteria bacterium]|nr:protein translocase subunit SecF [Fusobacteriota bacterium]